MGLEVNIIGVMVNDSDSVSVVNEPVVAARLASGGSGVYRQRFMVAVMLAWSIASTLPGAAESQPDAPSPAYDRQGLPVDDPNVRTNRLPLGVDEFRAPEPELDLKAPGGEVISVSRVVLPDRGTLDCVAARVKIKNGSQEPVIVDGNRALAHMNGKQVRALSEQQAMKVAGGQFTDSQKLLLAAVGIGTLGFCEPILQDHLTTSKQDPTKSYGLDERRRKLESVRLARRIILPGEEAQGLIIFPGSNTGLERISMPLEVYPGGADSGTLTLERRTGADPSVDLAVPALDFDAGGTKKKLPRGVH